MWKKGLSVLIICVLLVVVNVYFGEALTTVSYSFYFNHDLDEIADAGQEIDLLFIGASRVYRSYVPEIFEDKMDLECVVNAGTSSQPVNGTYYQLKDLIERFSVKRVIIGVTLDEITGEEYSTQAELIVYDRLSLKNKISYALSAFHGTDRLYALYTYRFRDNILNISQISEQKSEIVENNYLSYTIIGEYYADTGFVYSYSTYATGTIPIKGGFAFSKDKINDEKLEYLNKCIELCMENNIELSLVTGPTSIMRIYNSDNYQGAVDYYEELAEEYGISYYNLNYLVGREDFLPDELMHDYNHVNGEGAALISEKFADILLAADADEDVSEYFYDNLDALKEDVHRIVAVSASISFSQESNEAEVSITSLQNEDVTPLYRIEIKENDQEEYMVLADWTQESDIVATVPYEKDYSIKVLAMTGNDGDAIAYQTYQY